MSSSIQNSTKKLAESAETIERSTERVEDSADRRTELAADRTVFAAERTYAAWVRTGLFALASGLGAKVALAGVVPAWIIMANGSALIVFSAFCFIVALLHPLHPGPPPPAPDVHHVPTSILIAMNAFLLLVSLASLIGLWVGPTAELTRSVIVSPV
jgi:putative membrane protein